MRRPKTIRPLVQSEDGRRILPERAAKELSDVRFRMESVIKTLAALDENYGLGSYETELRQARNILARAKVDISTSTTKVALHYERLYAERRAAAAS